MKKDVDKSQGKGQYLVVMENIIYQIETNKSVLRGTMEAINSGSLDRWELKEFDSVRKNAISEIQKWVEIKKSIS